ncbi:MAG: amidohydrolase family protein [Oscillospiraceae bacterium]|jgi:predicted TIM-barrel fold metal-dependent hydrolase|nr:amidohydrolase family protein [Oscillospiraceae bacterium]
MKIIDAHMHFSNIQAFKQGTLDSKVDYSADGLLKEYIDNGIISCVCMGLTETAPGLTPDKLAQTPMDADLACSPVQMGICLGINPYSLNTEAVARIEQVLAMRKDIVGFKIYAGYYHVDINDDTYMPVYKLAAGHDLAVAVHGGETYFKGGLVEYSRPIHIDKLAHTFADMRIIICHMGFPWVMEACEIATKNDNVYVDISGLAVGGAAECERMRTEPLIRDYFRQGLVFMNDYKKVIFGTDWPLIPVAPYIEACKAIIPEDAVEDVFYNNAVKVYKM